MWYGECMKTVAQALESHDPSALERLEAAMDAERWEGLDLEKPMPSGAPLLAHWWWKNLNGTRAHGANRAAYLIQLSRLGWRLVDKGFDVRQAWHWMSPVDLPSPTSTTLRDVFLDADHRPLILELERRWGKPWLPQELSVRPLPPAEMIGRGQVSSQPRLIHHVSKGHVARVKWLLAKGVPPDLVDESGKTALFHAVEPATAKRLLARGASLGVVDDFGRTPLEHWAELTSTQGPAKVFMVAVSTPDQVSSSVLEKAFRAHLRSKIPLAGWAKPVLERLRPTLSPPSIYRGQTLMESAIGQAWNNLKIHDPEVFRWLLEHTPGKTRSHAWGALAWHTFGKPSSPLSAAQVKAWVKLLRRHYSDALSPTQFDLAGARVGSALLDLLPAHVPDPAGPDGRMEKKWLEVSSAGVSLVGQVMSIAATLMSEPPSPSLPDRFGDWAYRWAAHRSLPEDTLEPALRLLTLRVLPRMDGKASWATGRVPSHFPALAGESAPEPQVALAWWVNRHVSDATLSGRWPGSSPSWREFQDFLATSAPPWSSWGSALEAMRLGARIACSSVPTVSRPRM